MDWLTWIVGSAVVFGIGAYRLRHGKTRIVRVYVIATAVLLLIYATNLSAAFAGPYAALPKMLLFILLPGTIVLALMAVKRDRDSVMGRSGDREAITTAAIVYGAGTHTEAGGMDANGGMES